MREFIEQWGYIAVFLGSMVEGESVIFMAGFLARTGYLSIQKVTLIAFCGTLVADQGLYFIGHYYGQSVIERFPSMKPKADKAFRLLHRYNTLFILSFRFIYGIRTLSPLVIGAGGVSIKRFMCLNLIAALIWSISSCMAAYYLADLVMDHIHLFPQIILGLVIFGGLVAYGIHRWRKKKSSCLQASVSKKSCEDPHPPSP